jgi:hypothetical protein
LIKDFDPSTRCHHSFFGKLKNSAGKQQGAGLRLRLRVELLGSGATYGTKNVPYFSATTK